MSAAWALTGSERSVGVEVTVVTEVVERPDVDLDEIVL